MAVRLSPAQERVVRTIVGVGRRRGESRTELLAALNTAAVEANYGNPGHGDRDSVGWRQERSHYGSMANRMNVAAAANRFFDETSQALRERRMFPGQLAQAVQRSAFPGRYKEHTGASAALLRQYGAAGEAPTGGGGRPPAAPAGTSAQRRRLLARYLLQSDRPGALAGLVGDLGRLRQAAPAAAKPPAARPPAARPAGHGVGLVAFGRHLQSLGIPVTEHPSFGGVAPVHARGYLGNHYDGQALDVPVTGARADRVVREAERWQREGRLELLGPGIITSAGSLKRNPGIGGHGGHVHVSGRAPARR